MMNKDTQHVNYKEEILELLRSGKSPKVIKDQLGDYHANDMANVLEELSAKEREGLYRLMDTEELSETLEYCEHADAYLEEMDVRKAASVLEQMEQSEAVDILKESNSPYKTAWISLMSENSRKMIQLLSAYNEDVIASKMSTNFVQIQQKGRRKNVVPDVVLKGNISKLFF